MAKDNDSRDMGLAERILRSRSIRGIVRVHAGVSVVRSWSQDVQVPAGSSIHLFDYLLYRRTGAEEPFEVWIKERELSP